MLHLSKSTLSSPLGLFMCLLLFAGCAEKTAHEGQALTENKLNTATGVEESKKAPAFHSPLPAADVAFETFSVVPQDGFQTTLATGTVLRVPKNAFQYADGTPVTEKVILKMREFHDAASVIASGIPMKHEGHDFESAGMFELRGEVASGRSVQMAKTIEVDLATNAEQEDAYSQWYLEENPKEDLAANTFNFFPVAYAQAPAGGPNLGEPRWKLLGDANPKASFPENVATSVEVAALSNQQAVYLTNLKDEFKEVKAKIEALRAKKNTLTDSLNRARKALTRATSKVKHLYRSETYPLMLAEENTNGDLNTQKWFTLDAVGKPEWMKSKYAAWDSFQPVVKADVVLKPWNVSFKLPATLLSQEATKSLLINRKGGIFGGHDVKKASAYGNYKIYQTSKTLKNVRLGEHLVVRSLYGDFHTTIEKRAFWAGLLRVATLKNKPKRIYAVGKLEGFKAKPHLTYFTVNPERKKLIESPFVKLPRDAHELKATENALYVMCGKYRGIDKQLYVKKLQIYDEELKPVRRMKLADEARVLQVTPDGQLLLATKEGSYQRYDVEADSYQTLSGKVLSLGSPNDYFVKQKDSLFWNYQLKDSVEMRQAFLPSHGVMKKLGALKNARFANGQDYVLAAYEKGIIRFDAQSGEMLQFFMLEEKDNFQAFLDYPNGMIIDTEKCTYKLPLPHENPGRYIALEGEGGTKNWAIVTPKAPRAEIVEEWTKNQDSLAYFLSEVKRNMNVVDVFVGFSEDRARLRDLEARAKEIFLAMEAFGDRDPETKALLEENPSLLKAAKIARADQRTAKNTSLFPVNQFGVYNVDRYYKMTNSQEIPLAFGDKKFEHLNIFHITGKGGRVCIKYTLSKAYQTKNHLKFTSSENNLLVLMDENQNLNLISPEVFKNPSALKEGFNAKHLNKIGKVEAPEELNAALVPYLDKYF